MQARGGAAPTSPPRLRLAVVGKGGSGKSVVSGTIARLLARRGHQVLALDSDPMPGLAYAVGVNAGDEAMLAAYAEQGEDRRWRPVADFDAREIVRETARRGPDDLLFLQFGKSTTVTGPAVSSIQAFWALVHGLKDTEWTIVHDLPAGTRQAFAGWAGAADQFLIVAEPGSASLLSARRLAGLARERPDLRIRMVANKVGSREDVERIRSAIPDIEMVATLPLDPAVRAADRDGVAPIDHAPSCAFVREVGMLVERLEVESARGEAAG